MSENGTIQQGKKPRFLLGLDRQELRTLIVDLGEPAYRGNQVAQWVYRRGAREIDRMTNLPLALRQTLAGQFDVGRSRIVTTQRSADGTVKLLLATDDGQHIESVGLPYPDRISCCVSSQVGCPVRCAFCATGLSGYTRNLTAGEIVDQVLTVQDMVQRGSSGASEAAAIRVSHVVFMGMGEPLLNYANMLKAVRLLHDQVGISMRHITVSTVGYVPGILKLAQEDLQITLALSLHAPTDDLRRRLIPTMTRWSIADIMDACRDYVRKTGRRVTFEYCLLEGINDGEDHALLIARLVRGLQCHVNLIPFNPVSELDFRGPSPQRVRAFRETLEQAGVEVTQRVQRGAEIDAACGQLRREREAQADREALRQAQGERGFAQGISG